MSEARTRLGKLEAEMSSLGADEQAVAGRKEGLRQAGLQAQFRHVDDRIEVTKMFIKRSRKRVGSVRKEITKAQSAVREHMPNWTKKRNL